MRVGAGLKHGQECLRRRIIGERTRNAMECQRLARNIGCGIGAVRIDRSGCVAAAIVSAPRSELVNVGGPKQADSLLLNATACSTDQGIPVTTTGDDVGRIEESAVSALFKLLLEVRG